MPDGTTTTPSAAPSTTPSATPSATLQDFGSALEAVARSRPDAPAILAPGRPALCFSRLVEQMHAVRAALQRCGIGRGDRVAAVIPDGPEAAVAFLSIASCATFVPLNPDYTPHEMETYLALLRPKAIVLAQAGQTAARAAAAGLGIRILDMTVEAGAPAGCFALDGGAPGSGAAPERPRADDFALLLLSSGATARPKIIPIRHRQWLAGGAARIRRLRLAPTDRTLISMPLFHAHALFMLWPLVLAGASAVCTPVPDVRTFLQYLRDYSITCFSASFGFLEAVAAQIDAHREEARQTGLRFIKSGSGKLRRETMALLEDAFGAPVIEAYSNTESGVVTANRLDPGQRKPGTTGTAVTGEVAILGDDGAFLPPGAAGEIVVRGPTVFTGYFENPEADAAAFHDGWFRTGDMGMLDADGYLSVTGRTGDVINRGGEKIAPAEIESALLQHPGIVDAAAFAVPHRRLGAVVGAAVVRAPGATVGKADIGAFLRDRLSPFKKPSLYLFLDEIPRNALGKVVRRDLQAIYDRTR